MQPADDYGAFTSDTATKLDAVIQHVVTAFELPGLAVGIVRRGQVVYAQGFGVKRIATQEPVTPTSLFHMASVSKPFVATAILQLVAQGKVDLQAPVITYLPYFTLADERYPQITIQQMLSHVSGMPDEDDYHWEEPEYDDGALERYVRSLADKRLLFAPGQQFAYSNIAYEVLGDVIAKVSGQSFEAYVDEHILQPTAMYASTFLKEQVVPELGTTPHVITPAVTISPVYPYHRAHAPSSTLHSNVLEMCNWAIANLDRGSFNGKTIFDASLYDLAVSPQRQIDDGDFEQAVGLGWFLGTYRGHKTVGHSGADPGFDTNFVMLPEQALAVVVLANVVPTPTGTIARIALDILLGYEPELPKPPAVVPLSYTVAQQGLEVALQQASRLQRDQAEAYDFDEEWFLAIAEWLIDMRRSAEAVAVLRLSAALHPDSHAVRSLLASVCDKM